MSTRRLLALMVLLSLVVGSLSLAQMAWSQEITANIVGTVADPSDAPIVGASVTATDTQRGTTWSAKTDGTGAYTIPRVPIGTYEVKVTASGFQTAVYPPFTLTLNQTARVDAKMRIGQTSETVEVTGAAPVLQTETTEVSTLIDAATNVSLPLASR